MTMHPTFQAIFDQHFPPKVDAKAELIGAIRELLAELSPNARPDGLVDARFASETMARRAVDRCPHKREEEDDEKI